MEKHVGRKMLASLHEEHYMLLLYVATHARTHTHTRTHARTHARIHTHTHIYIYPNGCSFGDSLSVGEGEGLHSDLDRAHLDRKDGEVDEPGLPWLQLHQHTHQDMAVYNSRLHKYLPRSGICLLLLYYINIILY